MIDIRNSFDEAQAIPLPLPMPQEEKQPKQPVAEEVE
jgi:hypothetical protein